MVGMTDINAQAAAARENARHTTGQFGTQEHTAPGDLLAVPVAPADTVYGIYAGDALVSTGEKGAGMTDALHRARTHVSGLRPAPGETLPTITIRSEGSDVAVTLPLAGDRRIVGWTGYGDAVTAEEMDKAGVSLTQLSDVKAEPFIDLGPYGEGDLPRVEQWARDSGFYLSNVYAYRDEETGGRHINVALNENFLWNAETQCPDENYEDDSDLDPDDDRPAAEQRYDAWLNEHEDVVKEVYLEWFNAEIDASYTWGDGATVTIRKTVPYERFTESLVIEDVHPLLSKYTNEVDPGSFGSPYVMGEVRRRVEARQAEADRHAERAERGLIALR